MSESYSCSCVCGSVKFTAVPEAMEVAACHCQMCRRWSGGPYMGVVCSEVKFDDESSIGVFCSSDWAERVFCRDCGSSLMWRLRDGGGHMHVSSGSFPDDVNLKFSTEVFVDDKPSHYSFADSDDRLTMTGPEVFEMFGGEE